MEPAPQSRSRSRSRDRMRRSKVTSHTKEAITPWAVYASECRDYDMDESFDYVESMYDDVMYDDVMYADVMYGDVMCDDMVCDESESQSDGDIGFGLFDDCLVC